MKVERIKSYPCTKCMIKDGDSILSMEYGCNNAIYWNLDNPTKELDYDDAFELDFNIKKEDRKVYKLFEHFYSNLKRANSQEEELDSNELRLYSEEVEEIVANYVTIRKDKGIIRLNFFTQKPIEGYKKDFGSTMHIPIKISTSSNLYFPASLMYDDLLHLDDIMGYKDLSKVYIPKTKTYSYNNKKNKGSEE